MNYTKWDRVAFEDKDDAVFIATNNRSLGYVFGCGKHWPDPKKLPDIRLGTTIDEMFARFESELNHHQFPTAESVPLPLWGMLVMRHKYRADEAARQRAKIRTKFARICF